MVARAQSAGATRRRILAATTGILFGGLEGVTLNEVALRAGVSVQTVVRTFGGRAQLVAEAAAEAWGRVADQRGQAPPGDLAAAVKVLFIHYEAYGDRLVLARAREPITPELGPGLVRARADHRRWVARTFRPQLERHPEAARERVLAALLVATDVYAWKGLRRDQELPRREAEQALLAMLVAIAGAAPPATAPAGS